MVSINSLKLMMMMKKKSRAHRNKERLINIKEKNLRFVKTTKIKITKQHDEKKTTEKKNQQGNKKNHDLCFFF